MEAPDPFPPNGAPMNDEPRTGLTRRDALALGALVGAATLARGAAGPAGALAAPRSLALTVAPDAFAHGSLTAPLRAPGRFVLLGVRDPAALDAALAVRARRAGGRWTNGTPCTPTPPTGRTVPAPATVRATRCGPDPPTSCSCAPRAARGDRCVSRSWRCPRRRGR